MTVSLVTGANRGIGLEVVRQLAARGHVVLAGARDPAKVPAIDGDVRAVRLDVTDEADVEALRGEVGALDVLVNNAAIHYDTWQGVLDADLGVVREALETNTLGAWGLAIAFARERVLRRRAADRDARRGAGVLSLEGRPERGHAHACGRVEEGRRAGELGVPGLGGDGHGRPGRTAGG